MKVDDIWDRLLSMYPEHHVSDTNLQLAEFNCKVARVVLAILGAASLLSLHPITASFYFGAAYLTHEMKQVFALAQKAQNHSHNIEFYKNSWLLKKLVFFKPKN